MDMVCAVERKLSVDGGRIGVSGWEKRMMGMERDPSLSWVAATLTDLAPIRPSFLPPAWVMRDTAGNANERGG